MKMISESKQAIQIPAIDSRRGTEPPPPQTPKAKSPAPQLQEVKKKMLDAIGHSGFDAFAGTEPLKGTDSHSEMAETKNSDPGIDISNLLGENKQIWAKTLDFMNGKKK